MKKEAKEAKPGNQSADTTASTSAVRSRSLYRSAAERALDLLEGKCGKSLVEEFRAALRRFPNAKRGKGEDEHDEVCDVCEKGGMLMCCDTCSLAFHVACVRPRIKAVPKGRWSCAYCLRDKGDGSKEVCISEMQALRGNSTAGRKSTTKRREMFGVESQSSTSSSSSSAPAGSAAKEELTIVRSGRRFTLSQTKRGITSEVERFDNLKAALEELVLLGRQRQRRNSVSNSKPVSPEKRGPGRPRKEMGSPQGTTARKDSSSASSPGLSPSSSTANMSRDDSFGGSLWCMCCLDDPQITMCAFCGCRKCLFKTDSNKIILCDGCDVEYHVYCLDPPLKAVPTNKWYCADCEESGIMSEEDVSSEGVTAEDNTKTKAKGKSGRKKKDGTDIEEAATSPSGAFSPTAGATNAVTGSESTTPKRPRGRPRGGSSSSTGGRAPKRYAHTGADGTTLVTPACDRPLAGDLGPGSPAGSPPLGGAGQISCTYNPGVPADFRCVEEVAEALQQGLDHHEPALMGPLDLAMLALFREWASTEEIIAAKELLTSKRHAIMIRLNTLYPGILVNREDELSAAEAALGVGTSSAATSIPSPPPSSSSSLASAVVNEAKAPLTKSET